MSAKFTIFLNSLGKPISKNNNIIRLRIWYESCFNPSRSSYLVDPGRATNSGLIYRVGFQWMFHSSRVHGLLFFLVENLEQWNEQGGWLYAIDTR